MIHNRKLNKKINKVHERALRIVYGDHKTKFSELLNIDKSVTIHQRNLQYLLIEIYKVKKGISPTIMNKVFQFFGNPVKIIVKILNPFALTIYLFIYLLYNIMILPYNALLYLALIRPVFCIGAVVKPNGNKVCKKKLFIYFVLLDNMTFLTSLFPFLES